VSTAAAESPDDDNSKNHHPFEFGENHGTSLSRSLIADSRQVPLPNSPIHLYRPSVGSQGTWRQARKNAGGGQRVSPPPPPPEHQRGWVFTESFSKVSLAVLGQVCDPFSFIHEQDAINFPSDQVTIENCRRGRADPVFALTHNRSWHSRRWPTTGASPLLSETEK